MNSWSYSDNHDYQIRQGDMLFAETAHIDPAQEGEARLNNQHVHPRHHRYWADIVSEQKYFTGGLYHGVIYINLNFHFIGARRFIMPLVNGTLLERSGFEIVPLAAMSFDLLNSFFCCFAAALVQQGRMIRPRVFKRQAKDAFSIFIEKDRPDISSGRGYEWITWRTLRRAGHAHAHVPFSAGQAQKSVMRVVKEYLREFCSQDHSGMR
jgi:hypothetical protein